MISKVSFGSTYKVSNDNPASFPKFRDFAHQTYALHKELNTGVKIGLKDKFIQNGGYDDFIYKAEQILIVPDSMDIDVETYCANNGINYKKIDTKDLLNPETITSRIAYAPDGYRKVNVDAEKLEELAKKQDSNLKHCRSDYDKYYSDKIDTMLKSGDKIPATTLVIQNHSGNENLSRYVNKFGVNNLNDGQLFIDFNQKTNSPDHCVYFALKDMGINKIPVYVDKQSFEAGNILGLFQ